jgi:hypothetical protein
MHRFDSGMAGVNVILSNDYHVSMYVEPLGGIFDIVALKERMTADQGTVHFDGRSLKPTRSQIPIGREPPRFITLLDDPPEIVALVGFARRQEVILNDPVVEDLRDSASAHRDTGAIDAAESVAIDITIEAVVDRYALVVDNLASLDPDATAVFDSRKQMSPASMR